MQIPMKVLGPIAAVLAALLLVAAPASAAGEASIYPLPKETKGYALTVGPDGAIWFSGHHGPEYEGGEGDYVGRVTGAWEVSEFPLPKGVVGGSPVAGPQGALWFSTHTSGKKRRWGIARMTTAGQLHEFTLSHGRGGIEALTVVGDELLAAVTRYRHGKLKSRALERFAVTPTGLTLEVRKALKPNCLAAVLAGIGPADYWYAEQCPLKRRGNPSSFARLVRVQGWAETASFRLPADSSVSALTLDRDGGLWFSVLGASIQDVEFGRVTPAGTLSRWRVPNAESGSIAAGPEGRLYFPLMGADRATRELDSIGPTGDLGTPFCAGPKCEYTPYSLTLGPEGQLWYAAQHAWVPYGGGGGGALMQEEAIAKESGFLAHLTL